MSEDKLNLIKKYKFNEQILQDLEKKLEEIRTRPEDTVNMPNGDIKTTPESLLDKIVDACILNVELNLMSMKHQLAIHIEHELKDEDFESKMNERLTQALKMMGMNEDKDRFGP